MEADPGLPTMSAADTSLVPDPASISDPLPPPPESTEAAEHLESLNLDGSRERHPASDESPPAIEDEEMFSSPRAGAWKETREKAGDGVPSPSSSGYVGERGSSDPVLISDPLPPPPESAEAERLQSPTLDGSLDQHPASDETPPAMEEELFSSPPVGAWKETCEKDGDGVPSPSSSGYAGERGSSGGSSGIEEVDEARPVLEELGGRERHLDEDDTSASWRKRKKHFFILSNSGKPIYSRYGDEHKLAGFSATLQAIISFVENSGDRIKFVRAGKYQVVFLVKGPIYLVCITCTEEPYDALMGQLELIYGQMLLILTKSIDRCFEKNPKFDMSTLLGGTDDVFSALVHSLSWNPATFLHAYACLPLAYSTRQAVDAIMQDVADPGLLFAILMCKHKVINLVGSQKASLHPDDLFLLSNFILSTESFRTSESFSPICLPRYNPMAFLYAYVHFLNVDTYLTFLTTTSDAFYQLKDCKDRVEDALLKSNVLGEVQRCVMDGCLRVEDLPVDLSLRSRSLSSQAGEDELTAGSAPDMGIGGPDGLWHFIYKSIILDQFVSSEFSSPISNHNQQKRLYRAYQKLYIAMHDKGTGPHKTQFRRDEDCVLLCWITQDFELYAAFDPLADKALAIKTCNRVCQWVRHLEKEIFLLGANPFPH